MKDIRRPGKDSVFIIILMCSIHTYSTKQGKKVEKKQTGKK